MKDIPGSPQNTI